MEHGCAGSGPPIVDVVYTCERRWSWFYMRVRRSIRRRLPLPPLQAFNNSAGDTHSWVWGKAQLCSVLWRQRSPDSIDTATVLLPRYITPPVSCAFAHVKFFLHSCTLQMQSNLFVGACYICCCSSLSVVVRVSGSIKSHIEHGIYYGSTVVKLLLFLITFFGEILNRISRCFFVYFVFFSCVLPYMSLSLWALNLLLV